MNLLAIAVCMSLPVTLVALVVGASFLFLFRPFQRKSKEFGKKAFFHFGVNTFSNLEWGDGTEAEKLFNIWALDRVL